MDPTWYPLGKTITIQNGLVDGTKEFTIDALDYQIPTPEQGKWNVSGTLVNGTNALTHIPFSIHTLDGSLWYDTKSDSNGKFAFKLLDGSYEIDGIWVNSEGKWYVLDQVFTVKDGKLVGTTELAIDVKTMAPIDNVTGTLTKGAQALKNLTFSLHTATGEQIWYSATTDENGQFAFNLPDGSYIVEGIWNGAEGKWYVLQKEFTVSGTHSLNINVLTDVPPAAADNVTGVLTNGGAPLSNLVFSIHTTSGEVQWYDTTTDANGQFGFKLPDGIYKLEGIWVNSEGKWYNLQKEFTVDGTKVLNIDLSIN